MKQIGAAVKHDSTNFISKVSFYPTDTQTELLLPVPELRLMLLQQLRHQLLQTGYCHLRLSSAHCAARSGSVANLMNFQAACTRSSEIPLEM